MKRIVLVFVLTSLACSSSYLVAENRSLDAQSGQTPTETAVQTATSLVAVVIADEYLNVRTGPAVTYPLTFYLVAESTVEIVGECTVNGWVKIEYQDRQGWVNADYLNGSVCE